MDLAIDLLSPLDALAALDPLAEVETLRRRVDDLAAEIDHLERRDAALADNVRRVEQELRLAGRVQRDFLPRKLPQVGRARFSALFRPCGEVSGDFYDVARLDETHVGFYLADAVGHGVPAALLTMYLKRALATKEIHADGSYRLTPPAEAVAGLNAAMVEPDLTHAAHATAVYGVLNVETLACRFSRAGHPHPVLLRPGERPRDLETDGAMLGLFADERFEEFSITLAPGDRLVLYTDGVELLGGAERPDLRRWRAELSASRDLSAGDLVKAANRLAESAGPTLADDLTVLVVEAV